MKLKIDESGSVELRDNSDNVINAIYESIEIDTGSYETIKPVKIKIEFYASEIDVIGYSNKFKEKMRMYNVCSKCGEPVFEKCECGKGIVQSIYLTIKTLLGKTFGYVNRIVFKLDNTNNTKPVILISRWDEDSEGNRKLSDLE